MLRYNPRYQLFLACSDVVLVILALLLSTVLRMNIELGMEAAPEIFTPPVILYIVTPLIWLFAFGTSGAYTTNSKMPFIQTLRRVTTGHVLASLIFLGALYLIYRDFSRLQAFYFIALSYLFIIVQRAILLAFNSRLAGAINTPRRVIVVGTDAHALEVGAAVEAGASAGAYLVGYIGHQGNPEQTAVTALGKVDDIRSIVQGNHADEVIIALEWFDEAASRLITRIMKLLEDLPVNIRISPDYSELAYFHARPEDFNGVTLVGLRETVMTPMQRVIKRISDIVLSGLILLVTSPVMLVIAILIKIDSPGPAIYRQMRIGQHGRRFVIYKFRTMNVNADQIIDPDKVREMWEKKKDDPRVTRIGYYLRRTSLDELPQFFNVLKGDMSIVGPRPEVTWLADSYEWWQRKRFEVPQGITGWWQVTGRSDKPMRLNIDDDLYYVRNFSLWLDLQIMLRTIIVVFTGKGAY